MNARAAIGRRLTVGGACAETIVAICPARRRCEHPRGGQRSLRNKRRLTVAPTQRRRLTQAPAVAAPTTAQGLVRARTSAGANPATPNSASAQAMAGAE